MNHLFLETGKMSLSAASVILLVLLVRLGLHKVPKIYSYVLWAAVLFRLLCPVGIPVAGLPAVELPELPILEATPEPAPAAYPEGLEPAIRPELTEESQVQNVEDSGPVHINTREILPGIWMAGTISMLLYGLISCIRFRFNLVGACRLQKNIYAVDHIGAAYVVGLLRPRIYVDSGIPADQLPYIILHEQTHIRRGDPITRGLAFLALSLHWFNPLVWLAFILSGRDMEMSCDEAVIRRMGPKVRGPYSQSLLTLATGHHILLGSPVAFGEGRTGERVRNLARWKRTGKGLHILCAALTAAILTICVCEPIGAKAQAPAKGKAIETSVSAFENHDRTVSFVWNLQGVTEPPEMPIVEVEPHFLTEEEVQSIVYPFYGDAPIYNIGVLGERQYSEWELQKKISFLSSYLTEESREDLHLPEDNAADPALIPVELEAYQAKLSSAPKKIPHPLWDGTLEDQPWLDEEHRVLNLLGYVEDPYTTTVSQDSYRGQTWNSVHIELDDGGGWETARYIKDSLLHYGEKPSESEARQCAARAENRMEQAAPGQWRLDSARIRDQGEGKGYLEVSFSGRIQGVPMLIEQRSRYSELPEQQIRPPQAVAAYTGDGTLISIYMENFLKDVQVTDPDPKLLSLPELMNAVQGQLQARDAGRMLPLSLRNSDIPMEELELQVELTGIRFGLGLQKEEDQYYAVPAAQILGTVHCYQDGVLLGDSSESGDFLMTLNAVDGTVIG